MLFDSLKRRDQRHWARLYLRGLLSVEGRKTMRRIASVEGAPVVEQSLQQFISQSPWDWVAVRRSLACYAEHAVRPIAMVVEPVVILKSGEHSVGVERQFVGAIGRVANCQQAIGIWLASDRASYPIDWRLALPESWTKDDVRRRRAGIPDAEVSQNPEQAAANSIVDISRNWGIRQRPVVMDLRGVNPSKMIFLLSGRGIPFVVRVSGSIPVSPADRRIPYGMGRRVQGEQLIDALRDLRRPIEIPGGGQRQVAFVVGARVHTPFAAGVGGGGEPPPLVLFGAWSRVTGGIDLWLSNITQIPVPQLFRIGQTARQVTDDRSGVSNRLGLCDFEGRSFRGWHHHTTLVSAAHALWNEAAGRATASPLLVPRRRPAGLAVGAL